MELPEVVSREEWLVARRALLRKEKALTRARDAVAAERRRLPMVLVDRAYVFGGPKGRVTLADLFDGCRQLIVGHFTFDADGEEGSAAGADDWTDARLRRLRLRDTAFTYVSRAPLAQIEAYKASRGWKFPWHSSNGDFERDFDGGQGPGLSCFVRDGGEVYHTYSAHGRGAEVYHTAYALLDLTVLGRQEERELPAGRVPLPRPAMPDFRG
jgi:predicted dithiol-disulfide oxidoreductase (DUF899 family)